MRALERSAVRTDWTLPALLACADLRVEGYSSLPRVKIKSLTDDSRRVLPGSCFVAVRGVKEDGHRFIPGAVAAGAVAVVVDRDAPVPPPALRMRVKDTRPALARLAAAFYGLRDRARSSPRMIGITGTNGKTTVAWLLRSILQAEGHRTALLGTIRYDLLVEQPPAPLTTPSPLDLCRHLATARTAGADFVVLEVSSHALDQHRTAGITFAAGVFTNLSGDHLDYHGSMDAYWKAKRRLFEALNEDAVAVVNADDPVADLMIGGIQGRAVTFGINAPEAAVRARIEAADLQGSRFLLTGGGLETKIRSPLIGRHNVMNALAAAATAHAFGVAPEAIRLGIERTSGVPGRLQRVDPPGCPLSVLVDYAHTDDALRNILTAVRPLTPGRLMCVFGCGGDRDRGKRPRMGAEELLGLLKHRLDGPAQGTNLNHFVVHNILRGVAQEGMEIRRIGGRTTQNKPDWRTR